LDAVPSKANGICFCTGSLGVRAENDLPAMAKRFAPRIGFAHLRATKREGDGLSFFESDHLDGDVDMIAVLKALLIENSKRSSNDRIVFRPDHGHRMLDDLAETKRTNPGYTAIGRLRGLAELRGAIRAIDTPANSAPTQQGRDARTGWLPSRWNTSRRGRDRAICLAGSTSVPGCFALPRRALDAR
jgi:mannonate dehydratase